MEDDDSGGRSRRYDYGGETNGITLGGILSIKQTPPYRIHDRTLLDLIRDDPNYGKKSNNTWKMLRQKLRLRRAGTACTAAVPTLASHVHVTGDSNRTETRNSTAEVNSVVNTNLSPWWLNSPPVSESNVNTGNVMNNQTEIVRTESPVEEIEPILTEEARSRGGGGGESNERPASARMSLMSLLEFDGSSFLVNDEEEVDDVTVEDGGTGGGVGGGDNKYNNCCVCMVRHKGAAFIPCGHTFCRLCSRELFVKRASCPLCNHFIVEILDIF
ncbi:uncharacterized protein [Rutidosis leptorrhynchoides]|uniref:uncharacterized protein n=1 Tax=Rutidosis leptorrhynchoides TaxID=125765 RepID=UPI003A9A241D